MLLQNLQLRHFLFLGENNLAFADLKELLVLLFYILFELVRVENALEKVDAWVFQRHMQDVLRLFGKPRCFFLRVDRVLIIVLHEINASR